MAFFGSTVGLYIGPNTVQLAQLKAVAGRVQLINFVHIDIFEEKQVEGTDKDELIVNALRKALNKSKIDPKRVNTVLMPGMVLLRYFQMPKISPEEMEEAVRFEARKYIPFKLEEAVTGFYVLKDDQETRKLGILSLVTKEESIKHHLTVLHKVGISPTAVETASFALLRLLEYSQEIDKQKSNVVLYLYAQRLNIIILKNGIPYFVRDISLARKEEWIDDETAEFLMEGKISSSDSRVATLENMISELKISLEYYKKELGKEQASKIVLCGEIEGFDDLEIVMEAAKDQPDSSCLLALYLQKEFDLPVITIDPLKNVITPKSKPLPYTFPMLAVTIGAGMRNLTKSTVEIDLFRARRKTSLKTKVFVGKMIIGGLGGLVLSFAILFIVLSVFLNREKNVLEQEKKNRPKFMDLSHFDEKKLAAGEKEVLSRLNIHKKIVEDSFIVTDKLNIIPKLIPEYIWLSGLNLTVDYSSEKMDFSSSYTLRLSGNVFSEQKGVEIEMVNSFAEALKADDEFFDGFKVLKTGSVTRGNFQGVPVMSFELDCFSNPTEK